MNEELEKMENEYRKLFTGISFTSKIRYGFIYLPFAGKNSDSVALFKFSRLKGVLDTENIFGETFYLKIKSAGNLDSLRQYNQLKMNEKNKYNGYYYRLPDYADVSLLFGGKEMINGRFLIAQYGVVISLPPDIIDINTYPYTAALKYLQFGKP
jgi:hypothetical protein